MIMAFPNDPIYKLIEHKLTYVDSDGNSHIDTTTLVKKYCGGDRYLDIPFIEGNTDYQEYLEWVAEGNTAEAAD